MGIILNMRSIFAATMLFAAASAVNEKEFEFVKYVAKWNKSFSTMEEFAMRLKRYIEVDNHINEVNRPGSEETHTAAHN